ncbi:MAG: sensor histidine kinase [Geminicoccales bacterium]
MKPDRSSDQMGPLLDFLDRRQEQEFRTEFVLSQLPNIRIAVISIVFIMIFFGAIDSLLYRDETNLLQIWSARLFIFVPMAIAFVIFTYNQRYIERSQIIGFIAAALVGALWLLFIAEDGLHRSLFLMPNLIESCICVLFLIGLTLKYSIPLVAFLCFLYSFILYNYDLSSRMNIALVVSITVTLGLLILCAYQRETVARQLFVKNKEEQRAANRRLQENQRDLEWLRGLAAFLRHEVRQPVALVSSSLDIMQLHKPTNDITHQIRNAETGVRHVWSLIDRATRATDVEAFVRQSRPRWVDLDSLVGDLAEDFRQTYSGVRFVYEPAPSKPVALHIDPDLFKEAVGNLLNNAASFAEEGSDVKIAIARDADVFVITVVNVGPVIDGDVESLFSPFRSNRASTDNDHQGLGLYLVRLVAQHYGGEAHLKNLDDESGVIASISLPLKASANV